MWHLSSHQRCYQESGRSKLKPEFWHEVGEKKEIGFNQASPNELLVKHFSALDLKSGSRVFLPLCGKTIDIHWLLKQGMKVVGVELNESAVQELFQELDLKPEVSELKVVRSYSAQDIDILVGNVFDVAANSLGEVDAIYDRAALVALPEATRKEYAAHLMDITSQAPQLQITFEYDQSGMDGPPFSIPPAEIQLHYGRRHDIKELEVRNVEGQLKGQVDAVERICHLF